MDVLIIAGLLIAGIVFLLIELFLIPGTSFASLISGCCMIYAVYHAFANMGIWWGTGTLLVSILVAVLSVVWFMKSKTLDKVSLKKDIDGTVEQPGRDLVQIGDEGIALTRLTLIGNAQFHDHVVEVKSVEGFIEAKTPIRVVRKDNSLILVEPIH